MYSAKSDKPANVANSKIVWSDKFIFRGPRCTYGRGLELQRRYAIGSPVSAGECAAGSHVPTSSVSSHAVSNHIYTRRSYSSIPASVDCLTDRLRNGSEDCVKATRVAIAVICGEGVRQDACMRQNIIGEDTPTR